MNKQSVRIIFEALYTAKREATVVYVESVNAFGEDLSQEKAKVVAIMDRALDEAWKMMEASK